MSVYTFLTSPARSEIGKIPLDTVFRERESLNTNIVLQINIAAEAWGIDCKRYEIRDISVPSRVKEAMQVHVVELMNHANCSTFQFLT